MTEDRIVLVGRPGCHLCEKAHDVVARVAAETGTGWHEVCVDDDADLHARYAEQIPVVLLDGTEHAFFTVDEHRLREALAGRRGWLRRRRTPMS